MSIAELVRGTRRRYVKKGGKILLHTLDRFLGNQSLIGDRPFFDEAQFDYVETLENNWKAIRTELDELLKSPEKIPAFHQISPDQKRISKGDNWKTFMLRGFGRRMPVNCQRCPDTARVLDSIPRLQNAWFSILAPGYHIPPHRGVTKGLLRCHLGLMVPQQKQQCRIRVDNQTRYWEEGKCMVFDDTFDHEVWNETDERRVVLFLDIERPLSLPGRLVNKTILQLIQMTAYVKDAKKNLASWEDRVASAVQQADAFQRDAIADLPADKERRDDRITT
jgi:beta-hydroxylase